MDYFSVARSDTKEDGFSLEEIYGQMRVLLAGVIRDGQSCGDFHPDFDPEPTADLLVAFYDGVVLHDIFDRHGSTVSGMRAEPIRIIQKSILANSPGMCGAKGGG